MVHNGIEYGMMQAYAEGFSILQAQEGIRRSTWRRSPRSGATGSVVRSWLLDLTARALHDEPDLDGIAPYVADSGEGRWTVAEAIDLDVPAPVITLSLIAAAALARCRVVHRQAAVRAAQPVRRACDQES